MVARIKKRRLKCVATGLDIELYKKKPKMLFSGMIPRSDEVRNKVPALLFSLKVNDFFVDGLI